MSQRNADSIEYCVLNECDFNSSTSLHLAASKNDHQAYSYTLLLGCRLVQRNKINGDGLTFLDILRNQEQRDAGGEDLDLEQRRLPCQDPRKATYQTALQPPGGVHQSEDSNAGSMVMKQTFFILLWVFNTLGFCCAILYTFFLIPLAPIKLVLEGLIQLCHFNNRRREDFEMVRKGCNRQNIYALRTHLVYIR
ncbi:BnaA06g09330D [Brassica napus]|uniref:BnaA06g09330D protein n=1 Tax=Brassica napus TaxID=3708 RepID=A0A078I7Y1_BRANA|nr:BnaA06g09330D [Brassica napus]